MRYYQILIFTSLFLMAFQASSHLLIISTMIIGAVVELLTPTALFALAWSSADVQIQKQIVVVLVMITN